MTHLFVFPYQLDPSGDPVSCCLADDGPGGTHYIEVPVTHIDSLVSALYRIRSGQHTGAEVYGVVAKEPKKADNVVPMEPKP